MKKVISILMSIIAVFAVSTAFAMPALADVVVYSPAGEQITHTVSVPTVNNKPSTNVKGQQVANNANQITYTYTGSGNLQSWQVVDKNGKVVEAGSAYKVIANDGKTFTIEVLDWALFDAADGGYTVNAVIKEDVEAGKKDDSSKSPATGAATITLASMAAAGAGAAILALKKKDAE